jgi:D-aminoacyl-tRNA deacylase
MEPLIHRPNIIASRADPASTNIAEKLIKNLHFSKEETLARGITIYSKGNLSLVEIGEPGIYAKPGDIPREATTLIFASKHVSSSGKPALTVHTTGNPTCEALYGGNPEQLSYVDPLRIRNALRALRDESAKHGLDIEITMEATHHGPTCFETPVMFVEIGSSPKEWSDPILGEIAAAAIIRAAETTESTGTNAVGFGGTHYSAKHTRTNMEGNLAIGHIISRHAFDQGVSDTVIRQAFDRTLNGSNTALLDWKGLNGKQRQHLLTLLEEWNIKVERC